MLHPDAETCEDAPEKILRRELAGDLTERLLRRAQRFRDDLLDAPLQDDPLESALQVPADGDLSR